MNAADLLRTRAYLTPEREALLDLATGRSYTYAALSARADRAVHFLRSLGVAKGDRVALLAPNGVVYVDLLYAALQMGAIFTPLNWRLAAAELAYIVNNCAPRVLICAPQFAATLAAMRPEIDVPCFIALDGADVPGAVAYEAGLAAAPPEPPATPPLSPEDGACILYTSGTTGRPKGAVIPQRQILWNCINTAISWELRSSDVSPIFTPMFHAGGLFVFLTPLFYVGGRVIIAPDFDLEAALRTIETERCTVVLGVPTIFQMWLESPALAATDLSAVRWFISGGAPCPLPLLAAWRAATGTVFRQGYGLTEVGTNCFCMSDEESLRKAGSVGKPIFHSRMRLLHPDGGDVAPGEAGELAIAGPHLCAGYWQNPEATAAAIRDIDGASWFLTGDMARQDEEGYFYIAGRYKDMIISGGENVYAAEVEAVFLSPRERGRSGADRPGRTKNGGKLA